MTEPWLLYAGIFVLVTLAVHQLQQGFGDVSGFRRRKRRRLAELAAGRADGGDALLRRRSRLGDVPFTSGLARLLLQSGTVLPIGVLALSTLALAILVFVVLPASPGLLLRGAASVVAAPALVWSVLRIRRARRMALFGEQLPEVIDVIVRSLRAGHPLAVSLALVAREVPEPAGPEFAFVLEEVNYGRSLTEAMDNLYGRVGYPELRFFVAAISIAHQTGGNLGEVLSRLSRLLRERFRLTRRVRALSAEGRFSGYALSVMPVALFGLINVVSASYYRDFWLHPVATTVVAVAVALLVVGNLIIYRLVHFRV